jgi:thiol-disulfide isomerase/thioredoxin
MSARFIEAWKRFRSRFWLSLLLDVFLIGMVFFAIHSWQTRNLPINEAVPPTVLALLDGSGIQSANRPGEAGIVYFFAPWCFYCRSSIGNLQDLVADGRVNWGTVVALDYGGADEVQAFIDETGVTLPVLMGTAQTAADWRIRGYPTYYVIDARGEIHSRSVGYSTLAGMWFRNWLAQ